MRKFLVGLVIGFLLATAVGVTASPNISLIVNGNKIETDVPPQLIDGRVMVPARFVVEPLGATVEWDDTNMNVIITSNDKPPVQTKPQVDGWILHTNNILNKTRALILNIQKINQDDFRAMTDFMKQFNPIIQEVESYIPPTDKKDAYDLLEKYVDAVYRQYSSLTDASMAKHFQDPITYVSMIERADHYKVIAESMINGFLSQR
jgi:hypothetical protein